MNADDHLPQRPDASRAGHYYRLALLAVVAFAGGFMVARSLPTAPSIPPAPAVSAYLHVEKSWSPFVAGPSEAEDATFLTDQKALIASPDVLTDALRSSEVAA